LGLDLISDANNDCTGMLTATVFPKSQAAIQEEVGELVDILGASLSFLDAETVNSKCRTDAYGCGVFDNSAFGFHPLKYCLALADKAQGLGAHIFEDCPISRIEGKGAGRRFSVELVDSRSISAEHVVHCGSAYSHDHPTAGSLMHSMLKMAALPVMTYVMITNPHPQLENALPANHCFTDDRFACAYYRKIGGQLLYGGRVDAFEVSADRLQQVMLDDLLQTFPQLRGISVDVAWSGTMGYFTHKMPFIGRLSENEWASTGFGGHGMCTTSVGGKLIASAIAEGNERIELFKTFFPIPVGGKFARPAIHFMYNWYKARDRLQGSRLRS